MSIRPLDDLSAPPAPDGHVGPPTGDSGPAEVIRTDGLTKIYPARANGQITAVDHLGLSVRRGEILGLLGPSGAAKTTAVGMLTARVVPTSGRALVGGVDVVADPSRAK